MFKKFDFKNTALLLLIIVTAAVSPNCKEKNAVPSGPNIILVTIDTLRADHLSSYGYHRETSPFIDGIADRSLVFKNAYATSSWTAPSMASIFTGLYPRRHGVLHGVAHGAEGAVVDQEMLSPRFPTIAKILKTAGYTTFGVSSNGHVSRGTGFAGGFDYFKTHWFMKCPVPNNTVKKWLKHIRKAPRYFLWMHYFDPHNPYTPRMPWVKAYTMASGSYGKWTREPMVNPKEYIEDTRKDGNALNTLIDRYDSEINYCDGYIKDLLELLAPDDNTLIIITSDHGEAFLEHDQLLHGATLFDEVIRVPLLIKLPGKGTTGKTITRPVSNRDIFSTIVDIAGLETAEKIPGNSLFPLATGNAAVPAQWPIYYELDWVGFGKAVRSGDWKLIIDGREEKKRFLFDMRSDPAESRNLVEERSEEAKRLESLLKNWLTAHPQFKAKKIKRAVGKEQEDKLKSLGYL
ncbi:MAG: sulfatase-like hydrolase/transferase [bacterium]|nr:sulfatase-like hydrolase/transferase [bacterium]